MYTRDWADPLAAFEAEIYKAPLLPSLNRLLKSLAGFPDAYWVVSACNRVPIGLCTQTQLLQVSIVQSKLSSISWCSWEGLTSETGICWKKWVYFTLECGIWASWLMWGMSNHSLIVAVSPEASWEETSFSKITFKAQLSLSRQNCTDY